MGLLLRRRLIERLSETAGGLTLIAAGPGFGKSVAVRQLRESLGAPLLNYEVRSSGFVPFVRGFVEAAARLVPDLQASFAGAIELAMQSSNPHEEIALWLLEHLKSANTPVVAIEDVHRAAGDEESERLLLRLLTDSPSSIRWIFASRELPAFLGQSLSDAGIEFAHIGEDELRLTTQEAAAIAKSVGFAEKHVSALYEATQGIPAAFHFGAYAFDPADVPHGENAYGFYAKRYFERCPADLQQMLGAMCVVDEFDEDLLERSTWAPCAHYLATLASQGLIFSRRDGDGYRFHEPFRQMLLARFESDSARSEAERACALLFEAHGAIARALETYIHAGDAANVVRLCEKHGFDLADKGRIDAVRRALSCIGELQTHRSAVLLALKGVSESLAGRTDTAESWYLNALQFAKDVQLRATIAHRYAIDLIRQGRAESVELLEPYAASGTLKGELGAQIHSTLATAYVVATRFDDARAAIDRALRFTASCDSVTLHATIQHQVAWVGLFTGDVAGARQHASRAIELALSCTMYDIAARAYTVLYNITYDLEDDLHASLEVLNAVWDCGLKAGDVRMRLFALTGSFDIAAELGDTERLARMERMLRAHELNYSDQWVGQSLLPSQALRLAARGDFDEAFRLLAPTAERQPTDDRRAERFAEIALYAAGAGYLHEARAAIAGALERVDTLQAGMRRTLRVNAILAVALYLVGRRSDARERLQKAAPAEQHASLRTRVLIQALKVLFERWDGAENFDRLLDALEALRTSDFGGIAAVFAALPYRVPVSAA
jgi:ATP/maltotriose-dependent transcriptional regulator MalT